MPLNTRSHRCARQAGFSLIEVLVSMVVIAIGLLGFTGLQAYSLKSNNLAMQRSLAAMQAHTIIESMRANRLNLANYATVNAVACGGGVPATPIATNDRCQWMSNLSAALPSAAGTIALDSGGVAAPYPAGTIVQVTVTIGWNETTNATRAVSFATTTQIDI